jgi:Protein of unknown function DUF262
MRRHLSTEEVGWFLEVHASGQLDLTPAFQRRGVWSADYRRFFIDTVLRNFPSPAIFLGLVIEPGEPTRFNVIDGKQRLTALIDFVNGEFHLGDLLRDEGFERPFWGDLPAERQDALKSYVLSVENLQDATDIELREAFDRLNRNVARLTAQELRHAVFPGVFLERMEALAESPFWAERRVFTTASIRRMRDVEFVSELFLLTMHGVLDGASQLLDQFYADYTEEIPDEEEHRARFEAVMAWLEALPLDWRATRWRNMNDLYALWGTAAEFARQEAFPDPAVSANRLTEFSETQAAILAAEREDQPRLGTARDQRYYSNVRQGANKEANRQVLVGTLSELLAE